MMKRHNNEKRHTGVEIREMEIDDLAPVFHLGERLFTSKKVPTLYRTWDEYEVTNIFQTEPEFCLVAEIDDRPIGFALDTTITNAPLGIARSGFSRPPAMLVATGMMHKKINKTQPFHNFLPSLLRVFSMQISDTV